MKHSPNHPLQANTHIHLPPNSSAFTSVEDAVASAKNERISILGASNYYDHTVYHFFAEECHTAGIAPLFGIEIMAMDARLRDAGVKVNDPGNPGKTYLCGKGIARFAEPTPEASRLLARIRSSDEERMQVMADRLRTVANERGFPSELSAASIIDRVASRTLTPREAVVLQERHLAQALHEEIFERSSPEERAAVLQRVLGAKPRAAIADAVAIQDELRSALLKAGKPAFVEENYVSVEEAKRLVLELGGIPCYPVLIDGADPICPFEATPEILIENLRRLEIHCAEFIPVRNDPATLELYALALRSAGIAVVAGTEHNTPERIPVVPTARDGAEIPFAAQRVFLEGALVVLLHQRLVTVGQRGFVDSEGRPAPLEGDAPNPVTAFARRGKGGWSSFPTSI